jgi:hypothetical protein
MELLCHASAADYATSLKDAHTQSRHAEIGRAGQAIVAGTDYDGIESGHGFAMVGSAGQHNIPIGGTTPKPVEVLNWSRKNQRTIPENKNANVSRPPKKKDLTSLGRR